MNQPTVKFYGTKERRQITILEGEKASLPLRLTGDGVSFNYCIARFIFAYKCTFQPWKMKYKRAEDPDRIQTVTLHSPNDELRVAQKGLYEITEVISSILKPVILVLNNLRSSDH